MSIFKKKRTLDYIFWATTLIIISISILITNRFVYKLSLEEKAKIDLWAKGIKYLSNVSDSCQDFSFVFDVIQNNRTVPVILIDEHDTILSTRNIPERYLKDSTGKAQLIERFRNEKEPIAINLDNGKVNYVLYTDSTTLRDLSYFPIILLFIILSFIGVAYYAYRQAHKANENSIWIGLAKETAHQLGTPTSSLLACLDLLHEKLPNDDVVNELEKDISRLEKITRRFSKIGSKPQLEYVNLSKILVSSQSYLSRRITSNISFKLEFNPIQSYYAWINESLLEWVIENMVKNAADAMNGKGTITLRITDHTQVLFLDIRDTGIGIARRHFSEIFNPGFTTKERGWGLGLSLSKRIIEEYHQGKIFVLKSEINKGTTFRIVLNKQRKG